MVSDFTVRNEIMYTIYYNVKNGSRSLHRFLGYLFYVLFICASMCSPPRNLKSAIGIYDTRHSKNEEFIVVIDAKDQDSENIS